MNLDKADTAPEDRGPALELHIQDKRAVLLGALIVVGIIIVGASLQRGGFEWMSDPIMLGIVAVAGIIMAASGWGVRLTAGNDWLHVKRKWVDTHRLKSVHLYGVVLGWTLVLEDAEQRKVRVYIGTLEANRELWALVYNGLAHSVSAGATFNPLAGNMLRLRRFKESSRTQR
ncbi:hypothetical protein GIY23_05870 [Allosaccharopolyspora coralli]|uniref:DUF304 domain-containing protein n=1 Tax=Allosaccharopolyspora coralli TaxID=2665642 RepID=A0A5Q3QCC4_9PSEU|nr:hypothetical protein [Allosaccharopolyspora coralli]QGK69125.1 hypothetical protein GIY23_05870 [Allosaccharopolyspora coralli]